MSEPRATGRCLCGAVTYAVRGPLRDVILCHCVECRRWSGSTAGAFSATRIEHLEIAAGSPIRWIDSPESDHDAQRGLCGECGSSLFWEAPDRETISIAAGTLDSPTGLRTVGQIYTADAGDYYEVDPGLRRFDRDSSG